MAEGREILVNLVEMSSPPLLHLLGSFEDVYQATLLALLYIGVPGTAVLTPFLHHCFSAAGEPPWGCKTSTPLMRILPSRELSRGINEEEKDIKKKTVQIFLGCDVDVFFVFSDFEEEEDL